MFYIENEFSADELAVQLTENMSTYDDLIELITSVDLMIGDSVFTESLIEALQDNN